MRQLCQLHLLLPGWVRYTACVGAAGDRGVALLPKAADCLLLHLCLLRLLHQEDWSAMLRKLVSNQPGIGARGGVASVKLQHVHMQVVWLQRLWVRVQVT